jgi:uncharacterized protein YndB with AHSA1/START domain
MITESSVEIDAPATTVWDVFSAVERWPDWTASVERVTPLDGAVLQIGRRFEIKQPRMPKIVWEVTAVKPGVSWTWRQRSLGATTFATHDLTAQSATGTVAHQRIEQRGLLGVVTGVLMRRLTKRYLQMEGDGLKARSEQRARANASLA